MVQAVIRLVLLCAVLAVFAFCSAGCSQQTVQTLIKTAAVKALKNTSDESLRKMFEQANKQCPQRMDAFTTLEEIVMIEDNRVEYRYKVNAAGKQLASRLDTNAMQQAFVDNMKGNPMAVAIAERDLAIDHIYNDESGNYVLSYTIDRAVLDGTADPSHTPRSNPYGTPPVKTAVDSAFYADTSDSASDRPRKIKTAAGVPGIQSNPFFSSGK